MGDIYDRAEALEALQRQQAIECALAKNKEPAQLVANSHVYCLRCTDIIPPERLVAKPNAAYCIHCQQLREKGI